MSSGASAVKAASYRLVVSVVVLLLR